MDAVGNEQPATSGEEAQINFGTGAPIIDSEGQKRRTHVLRVVLSHSRKAYSEVVWRQTTECFITAIENAFYAFGGVPRTIVVDNLKAAVIKAGRSKPLVRWPGVTGVTDCVRSKS